MGGKALDVTIFKLLEYPAQVQLKWLM